MFKLLLGIFKFLFRHPNPVHFIKVLWDFQEKQCFIRYKFHATSSTWRPQHRADTEGAEGEWKFDKSLKGWKSLLKDVSTPLATPALAANQSWENENSVRHSIMRLNVDTFPGWSDDTYREWQLFWSKYHSDARIPSLPFSIPALFDPVADASTAPIHAHIAQEIDPGGDVSRFKEGEDLVTEAFVVGNGTHGKMWTKDRAHAKTTAISNNSALRMPSLAILHGVRVGEHVVIFPDEESRKADEEAGYNFPFSIGEVYAVDLAKVTISVKWMRATFVDDQWEEWVNNDDETVRVLENEDLTTFQHEDLGMDVMRIKFTKGMRINKPGLTELRKYVEPEVWSGFLKPRGSSRAAEKRRRENVDENVRDE